MEFVTGSTGEVVVSLAESESAASQGQKLGQARKQGFLYEIERYSTTCTETVDGRSKVVNVTHLVLGKNRR